MNKQNPVMVFVGERAESIREQLQPEGWLVYIPTEMMEALAMYVFYVPDVVVIDSKHPDAYEVHAHLNSIGADNLLVIGEDTAPDIDDDILIAHLRTLNSSWEVCTPTR